MRSRMLAHLDVLGVKHVRTSAASVAEVTHDPRGLRWAPRAGVRTSA
jgi:hypothetical protein